MKSVLLSCFMFSMLLGSMYDRKDHIVTDNVSKLMWQDEYDNAIITRTWKEAETYCHELRLGKYDDWRLPSSDEFASLIDESLYPHIDPIFRYKVMDIYWTATPYIHEKDAVWVVFFQYGSRGYQNKNKQFHLRCVRSID